MYLVVLIYVVFYSVTLQKKLVCCVSHPASSKKLFPDYLQVKPFSYLALFVAFYAQQGVLGVFSF